MDEDVRGLNWGGLTRDEDGLKMRKMSTGKDEDVTDR